MDWRESAACRGADPELFFPVGDGGAAARQTARARAVCRACPVMRACRTWAVRNGEPEGVWGATTAAERRALRRRRIGRLPEG
ncbi:MAG TPA: WhiB family transcriptional regulator [Streptomyces sp.]|uniref:WhiB family transcriptional regulator n=1 Tax=Streptomyces sp. TaxID=1931 RepID=UPI002D516A82|nr:WhiB family transcriptional regulator [Streptomyces sp.]HZG07069.1 WhiB family transcriptional regulator [Streptomyces sp.]